MANIKCFSFFKSYYESIKDLEKNDKNEIINAILEYVFEDKKPKFKGIKKTIWVLIEPNLNKSKNRSNPNSGAPLGNKNASKEKQSKNNQKTTNHLLGEGIGEGEGEGEGIGKECVIDYPRTHTEVFDYCFFLFPSCAENDLQKSCKKFYNYYHEKKWEGVNDWKTKAEMWVQNDIDDDKIKIIDTSRRLD